MKYRFIVDESLLPDDCPKVVSQEWAVETHIFCTPECLAIALEEGIEIE